MDTYHVKRYNNGLNIYHDKIVIFGNQQYEMRTNLTTLHWNENVDRNYTSIWNPGPGKPKKCYKPRTYDFKHTVWARFMGAL